MAGWKLEGKGGKVQILLLQKNVKKTESPRTIQS